MVQIDLSRRTKIVATIGPSTESADRLKELIIAGATTFRLNFSHGDHSEHAARIKTIRQVAQELNIHIGILQDLQGPKIRLGRFEKGPITVRKGDRFSLTSRPVLCSQSIGAVTYDSLANDIEKGSRIMLDDGRVEMEVESIDRNEDTLHCIVICGGVLSNNKGVNFPGADLSVKALTNKDCEDLAFGLEQGIDWVALSFVKSPSDIKEIKNLIRKCGYQIPVIAKIEKFEAIQQIDEILPLCDGVMVARGDLGVEMPAEEVPLLQKELIRKANSLGIPIITATQMLDSMVSIPRPTRAEVSDVANAILDGTDAIMLSNETAVGDYPVEAVATMAQIARRIEKDYPQRSTDTHLACTIPNAISHAVSTIARQLDAAAILPLTKSGATAYNVSKFRPSTPILAVTSEVAVARRLQLIWGVNPLLISQQNNTSKTFILAMGVAQKMGILKEGDLVIQTAGTLAGVSGSTDLLKVGIVSTVLGRGVGIGVGLVTGKVCLVKNVEEAILLKPGEILVTKEIRVLPIDQPVQASGIILETNVNDTEAKFLACQIGIPAIVNVPFATRDLQDGEIVILQIKEGLVMQRMKTD
uniref:Pyruvate kinase n=1 Tax=Paulinella chromatophora TaxID=39717 RepID=B1X3V7_PAUCH|nr:pyruvate kinase [Paulinella chromatophora]ACB42626.1 pyruvate kinase [Paulinella chromatophora]